MEKRLGRGLSTLLSTAEPRQGSAELSLHAIQPNPFQPRKVLEAGDLEQLRESIVNHGVLQPVVVRRAGEGYQLISGERRWRAARLAGLSTIPVVIREQVSDDDMLELALVENVQRKDLNAIEKAEGYRTMMDNLGLTQEAVAAKVGLRRSSVANHLRLLELPQPVREAVARRAISMGHAKALLGLPLREDRVSMMEECVRGDMSVRELESRVRSRRAQDSAPAAEAAPASEPTQLEEEPVAPWIRATEERLRNSLETRVQIVNGPDYRGKIVVDYFGRDQLDGILNKLAPQDQV